VEGKKHIPRHFEGKDLLGRTWGIIATGVVVAVNQRISNHLTLDARSSALQKTSRILTCQFHSRVTAPLTLSLPVSTVVEIIVMLE
jgi:hypothetical protein